MYLAKRPRYDRATLGAEVSTGPTVEPIGFSYMATALRLYGRRYFTYSNDHPPAHIHVTDKGNTAKFELNCINGPVVLVSNRGYSRSEVSDIRRNVELYLATLCTHWRDHHGAYR